MIERFRSSQGGFRRLRAATYFAHGGSSSQWPRPPSLVPSGQFTLSPLHSVSAWRRKLRSFPCSSSSRQTRCAGLRREQRGIGQNAAGDAADGLRLRCAPPRSIGPPPYPLRRFTTSPPDRGSRPPDPITGVTPWTLCGPSGAQYQECLGAIPSGPTGGLSGKKIGTGAVLFLRLPLPNQRSQPPGRAVLLTDGRPQDRAARTCINPGIEGGPVCRPCGNRATSQDTPSSRAELEPHQPQRRAFHR